jgi:hypothetical protein
VPYQLFCLNHPRSVQVLQHVLPERKRPGGKKKIPSTSSQDIAVSMSKGLLRTATTPLSTSSEAKKSNSSSRGGKHESRSTSQGRGGSSDGLGEGAHPSGSSTRDTSNYGADYGLEQLVVHPLFAGGRIFSALVFSRLFAQVRAARRLLLAACRLLLAPAPPPCAPLRAPAPAVVSCVPPPTHGYATHANTTHSGSPFTSL